MSKIKERVERSRHREKIWFYQSLLAREDTVFAKIEWKKERSGTRSCDDSFNLLCP